MKEIEPRTPPGAPIYEPNKVELEANAEFLQRLQREDRRRITPLGSYGHIVALERPKFTQDSADCGAPIRTAASILGHS
jgi:hypothetical protein